MSFAFGAAHPPSRTKCPKEIQSISSGRAVIRGILSACEEATAILLRKSLREGRAVASTQHRTSAPED